MGRIRVIRSLKILTDAPLLLDTHAFAWWLGHPNKLAPAARERLVRSASNVFVSVVSIWEMALKHRRGRWPEIEVVVADPAAQIAAEGMKPLPIVLEHARLAGLLDWVHRDPFDRMLAAQAIAEGAILVTADPVFATFPTAHSLATLWA